jgi:hypothetical protein
VGPGGSDTVGAPNCGALATPCATVAKGLTSAVTPNGQTLWLFPGRAKRSCRTVSAERLAWCRDAAAAGGPPAGTYTGAGNINVLFNSRPITVQGIGGSAVTLFDTQGVGPAFQFVGTESSTSVLKGWRATCLRLLRALPPVGWPSGPVGLDERLCASAQAWASGTRCS